MYVPNLTHHNYRQWMLQQQQHKDEVLAFEVKEPCTPLGTVRTKKFRVLIVSSTSTKLGVKWKKNYNNFFVYLNIKDNILHGESEVRM